MYINPTIAITEILLTSLFISLVGCKATNLPAPTQQTLLTQEEAIKANEKGASAANPAAKSHGNDPNTKDSPKQEADLAEIKAQQAVDMNKGVEAATEAERNTPVFVNMPRKP